MTKFLTKPARPYHCGQIARRLRGEQSAAVAGFELNCHRELRARFEESSWKRAWFINGELAALGGVTGTELSASGNIWLAVAGFAARYYPVAMVKEARRQLDEIMATRQELLTAILATDVASVRFAYALGFVPVEEREGYFVMAYRPGQRMREAA